MRRILARILAALGIAVLVVLVLVGGLLALGFRVDLDPLRGTIESAVSRAVGRRVTIAGKIEIVPAFYPTFEVQDVGIGNPKGWEGDFLRIGRARLAVGVLPLLWGRATVDELRFEDALLRLERRDDGGESWQFGRLQQAPGEEGDADEGVEPAGLPWIREVGLSALNLRDLQVEYRDEREGEEGTFVLHEGFGTAATDGPFELRAKGALGDQDFSLDLEAGTLRGLVRQEDEPWPLGLRIEIAGARLEFSAALHEPLLGPAAASLDVQSGAEVTLDVAVSGERLDSLSSLARTQLPEWGPWRLAGVFAGDGAGGYRSDVSISVGSSELTGLMRVGLGRGRPEVSLELRAETVQLDDFAGLDLEGGEDASADPDPAPQEDSAAGDENRAAAARLVSEETFTRIEAKASVEVGVLLSGRDRLGAAHLEAELHDGRLVISPVHVELPGGSLDMEMTLHPRADAVETELAVRATDFDLGVLARRLQPESEAGGQLVLDVSLRSQAPTLPRLMAHANGEMTLGVFPENVGAGLIDLWVANLLVAVLPLIDQGEGSVLHCAVGSFDLVDGVLTERSLMLDTSTMRVAGTARVDFAQEQVAVELVPRAKRPRVFNLATPISVNGEFDDFGVGVSATDLVGTVVRLATGIVEVPARYLMGDVLPEDGRPDCRAALDPSAQSGQESGARH